MSKYKVGDKIVLTVSDMKEKGYYPYYEFNNNFNLWEQSIDDYAEPLTTYTEQARANGTEAAWELAKKIVLKNGYSAYDLHEIFNCCGSHQALEDFTYPEAAAKVAEWEKGKDEIKVGDIVKTKCNTSFEFCVTDIDCNGYLYGIGGYGETYSDKNPEDWKKTGRHIDIDSFLKQIGGEQE